MENIVSFITNIFKLMSQSIPTGYTPWQPPRISSKRIAPEGRDLSFESFPGAENSTRARILWKMKENLIFIVLNIKAGVFKYLRVVLFSLKYKGLLKFSK